MSEEGRSPSKRTAQRLASVHSPHPGTEKPEAATVSSLASNLRETTLGGVAKTKFAPVVSARRAKKETTEPEVAAPVAPKPVLAHDRQSTRGRGRGRCGAGPAAGGRGLLGDRGAAGPVSGPFSLGPTSLRGKSTVAPSHATFTGGVSAHHSGTSRFGRGSSSAATSYADGRYEEDGDVLDLEKVIDLERLELGDEYCPVHIAAPDTDKMSGVRATVTAADIIKIPGQIILLQMPTSLPALQTTSEAMDEDHAVKTDDISEGTEGEYGKLCVHESGRLSLLVNGIRYWIELGCNPADVSHVGGSQTFVAIDPEYEQSFELGQVHNTLVGSLDFDSCML